MSGVTCREADIRDLPSIGTLHARAFHPTREWHRRVFPSEMSSWWEARHRLNIEDPDCQLLVLAEAAGPSEETIVGLLSMRRYRAGETGAGRWTSFAAPERLLPPTEREAYDEMVRVMVESREAFMMDRPHFGIDHLAVDAATQGRGLGRTLMDRACALADREGLDVFVEANEFAESFYHRFGFVTTKTLPMPGGMAECILIRRAGGTVE
jgi:ribosomal protein S18 acetylase RimI-like enzyme